MDGSRVTQLKPIFFSHGMRIGSLPHIPYSMAVSPIYLSPTMWTLHKLKFSTATTHSQDNFICPRWSGNHTPEWLQNMYKSFSIPPWGLSGLSIITRVDLGLARGYRQGHRRIGIWILEEKALLLCLSYLLIWCGVVENHLPVMVTVRCQVAWAMMPRYRRKHHS